MAITLVSNTTANTVANIFTTVPLFANLQPFSLATRPA